MTPTMSTTTTATPHPQRCQNVRCTLRRCFCCCVCRAAFFAARASEGFVLRFSRSALFAADFISVFPHSPYHLSSPVLASQPCQEMISDGLYGIYLRKSIVLYSDSSGRTHAWSYRTL